MTEATIFSLAPQKVGRSDGLCDRTCYQIWVKFAMSITNNNYESTKFEPSLSSVKFDLVWLVYPLSIHRSLRGFIGGLGPPLVPSRRAPTFGVADLGSSGGGGSHDLAGGAPMVRSVEVSFLGAWVQMAMGFL